MLAACGLSDIDELFDAVPEALRLAGGLDMADQMSEPDVMAEMNRLASANSGANLVCFAGGGAYDHEVPAVVRRLGFRSEFVTAYTPYQPEVAQGVLQMLFEYQTLVARLAGLAVANASLYDGASALVEAGNLAVAAQRRSLLWVSEGIHPTWREVLRTFAQGTGHEIVEVPLKDGVTDWSAAGDGEPAALMLAQPNHLGCLEDVGAAADLAHSKGGLCVVAADPVSAGLLRSPGELGADVVVGEGQTFGTPMSFGGPYVGLFASTMDQVRRLPGRLVGETVDTEGRRAYVTTLRAREQDIRREKASSNVCTNQTLIAVAFAIQLSWLGTHGLRDMALRCARGTRYAREALLAIEGVELLAPAPTLREFALALPLAPETVIDRLAEEGFLAGIALPEARHHGPGLAVAVTERRTKAEIDAFAAAFEKAVA